MSFGVRRIASDANWQVLDGRSRQWLDGTIQGTADPTHEAVLLRFATWHHLRRMRTLTASGRLRPGYIETARQSITVAHQFLQFLTDRGRELHSAQQSDIDNWLAEGPTARSTDRTFGRWAMRTCRGSTFHIARHA
ncbi:MAG: hypothetical protein ACK5MR_12175 [Cumulibacter sp.]